MPRSRLNVSTYSQRQGKRYNPADVMQTARRAGIWRGGAMGGRGFWKGSDEGITMKFEAGAPSKKGFAWGKNATADQLGQEAMYEENTHGAHFYSQDRAGGYGRQKYFVTVKNGRNLPEYIIRENINHFGAFAGGTIYERGNDIVVESAEIDPIDRNKVYAFARFMTNNGYPTRVSRIDMR